MAETDKDASIQYEGGVEPGEHGRMVEHTTTKEKREQKKANEEGQGGLTPGVNGHVTADKTE